MNPQEKEQLIKEIFSNEEYVKGLFELDTPEEVQASLKEKGLEITVEEIMQVKELLPRLKDGELSDEDLESVSGGACQMVLAIFAVGVVYLGLLCGVSCASRNRW